MAEKSSNRILSRLSAEEHALVGPRLEPVALPAGKLLESSNRPIEHIYFIERGFASVVADRGGGLSIGIIGREGMTGLAVIMGTDRSPNETYMQIAGDGQRIAATNMRELIAKSDSLHHTLLRYGHAFTTQIAQTVLANGRGKIQERLARWLLMAHDRIEGDQVPLTHKSISIAIGVHRPGVTLALKLLENEGLVRTMRGGITIVDRSRLRKISNRTYGTPEAEYRRLFG